MQRNAVHTHPGADTHRPSPWSLPFLFPYVIFIHTKSRSCLFRENAHVGPVPTCTVPSALRDSVHAHTPARSREGSGPCPTSGIKSLSATGVGSSPGAPVRSTTACAKLQELSKPWLHWPCRRCVRTAGSVRQSPHVYTAQRTRLVAAKPPAPMTVTMILILLVQLRLSATENGHGLQFTSFKKGLGPALTKFAVQPPTRLVAPAEGAGVAEGTLWAPEPPLGLAAFSNLAC